MYGGSQGVITAYNDVYKLKIDYGVQARNCYASGTGLTAAISDVPNWFALQFREHDLTPTSYTSGWGANLTFAQGLMNPPNPAMEVFFSSSDSGVTSLTKGSISEVGGV